MEAELRLLLDELYEGGQHHDASEEDRSKKLLNL